jgi:hypothetical protein
MLKIGWPAHQAANAMPCLKQKRDKPSSHVSRASGHQNHFLLSGVYAWATIIRSARKPMRYSEELEIGSVIALHPANTDLAR